MNRNSIITPEFLQKLELLQIMSKKVLRGSGKGERSSFRKGRSVEFADYRNYVMGDEIRTIDWNVYGRLDKLFVKLFIEEEELTLYILLDRSLSMDFGIPSKLEYAKKIAAALSYIALSSFDRVALGLIDTSFSGYQQPVRGKNQVFRIFDFLNRVESMGTTSLSDALTQFASENQRPGIIIILSDFLDQGDWIRTLSYLIFRKHDLFLIQVLDPEEVSPTLGGDVKFVDVETGDIREVTVTERLLALYRENFEAHCDKLDRFSRNTGCGYLQALTSIPFEDLVLKYFRSGRLIR